MEHRAINNGGAGTGSLASYLTGFMLAVILTVSAFALVMKGAALPHWVLVAGIFTAAVVQILVHLHYFLHLDRSSEARWNVLALIFTVFIMVLFVVGTLWIMYDLNMRMM
jgi:cytochrome o ubiquinol oxidase operon protein cyoD